ncbi:MAG TPA: type VI secretion system baseplate subunit TssG [Burkholderiaceae bacterium]
MLAQLFGELAAAPHAFDFYALMRRIDVLSPNAPRLGRALRPTFEPVRLGQDPELDFAPAAISSFETSATTPPRIGVRFFGLFGPHGPLPLHLTEYARERLRHHADPGFARFADLFHHRLLALFYRAWAQAQPTVQHDRPADDQFAKWLGALFGLAPRELRERDAVGDDAKRFQAGLLARGVKNAEGLVMLLQHHFGVPVRVQGFVGHWMRLRPADRTRLETVRLGRRPEASAQLGVGATLGSKVWDRQSKFRIHLGPLTLAQYESFLPGSPALPVLRDWVRQYVGLARAWDVRLALAGSDVPAASLGRATRLGYTSWLGGTRRRGARRPATARDDLVFSAERILEEDRHVRDQP